MKKGVAMPTEVLKQALIKSGFCEAEMRTLDWLCINPHPIDRINLIEESNRRLSMAKHLQGFTGWDFLRCASLCNNLGWNAKNLERFLRTMYDNSISRIDGRMNINETI